MRLESRIMSLSWLALITLLGQGLPEPQKARIDGPSQKGEWIGDCMADGSVVNGITGQALSRAKVIPSSAPKDGVSTDIEGRWAISHLPCGATFFTAEKVEYIANSYGRSASFSSGSGGAPKPAILTPGSATHGLNIELMPKSVVEGSVRDEAGDPVLGAQVRIMQSVVQNGLRTTVPSSTTITNSSGGYRLYDLVPGRYFVCATSHRPKLPISTGEPVFYGESCLPGPVTPGAEGGLRIGGGQDVTVNFALTPVVSVHVRGTLIGIPTTAPPGSLSANKDVSPLLIVQMLRVEASGMVARGAILPQEARTGKFDFPNVAPGSYMLVAYAVIGGPRVSAMASIDVADADVEGISLMLQPSAPVKGTLRIEDVAQSPSPHPNKVAGPPVAISLSAIGVGGPVGQVEWSSEHDSFVFSDVPVGVYHLNVTSAQAGYFVKSTTLNGSDLSRQNFAVVGPTNGIEIVISESTGVLRGALTDSDGHPAAGIIVLRCGQSPILLGRSEDDGIIRIPNVPLGTCKAWAFDDGSAAAYSDDEWMQRYGGEGSDVTISNGGTSLVSLSIRVTGE